MGGIDNMDNIKQLEERITQLTELVKSGSEAIESMKTALIAAEKERDRLADQRREQELKFERVEKGKIYFTITGELKIIRDIEGGYPVDDNKYNVNNYFYTKERAEEVANKIELLLKLERLHDIYCSDYKPDWSSDETKYLTFYSHITNRYSVGRAVSSECLLPCFPTEEIAQKVCDVLNEVI